MPGPCYATVVGKGRRPHVDGKDARGDKKTQDSLCISEDTEGSSVKQTRNQEGVQHVHNIIMCIPRCILQSRVQRLLFFLYTFNTVSSGFSLTS